MQSKIKPSKEISRDNIIFSNGIKKGAFSIIPFVLLTIFLLIAAIAGFLLNYQNNKSMAFNFFVRRICPLLTVILWVICLNDYQEMNKIVVINLKNDTINIDYSHTLFHILPWIHNKMIQFSEIDYLYLMPLKTAGIFGTIALTIITKDRKKIRLLNFSLREEGLAYGNELAGLLGCRMKK